MFDLGLLELDAKARIETVFWQVARKIVAFSSVGAEGTVLVTAKLFRKIWEMGRTDVNERPVSRMSSRPSLS